MCINIRRAFSFMSMPLLCRGTVLLPPEEASPQAAQDPALRALLGRQAHFFNNLRHQDWGRAVSLA
jgi:hypothetical protein